MKSSSMRDEAVVRTPCVQMLSLMATGTPASGASRQRSRSRSITPARASARSAITVLKALSMGLSASMRASASRQTSVAERAPDSTALRTSRIVTRRPVTLRTADCGLRALNPRSGRDPQFAICNTSASPDDPRHLEEAGVERGVGRVRQRLVAVERWAHLVRPVDRVSRHYAGRGRDARGVNLLHFVSVREDVAELARE